jgi:hypothetical protein
LELITIKFSRVSKRDFSPSFSYFPLSFTLPPKERGIKGVRLKNFLPTSFIDFKRLHN